MTDPATGADDRRIEYRDLKKLRADPRNPKAHAAEAIEASVSRFGFVEPIVVDERTGFIASGRVLFEGEEISSYPLEQMRDIRGNRISMIFQDPMMTLNPVLTIGTQMVETILAHNKVSVAHAREIALEKLSKVYISSPGKRLGQ